MCHTVLINSVLIHSGLINSVRGRNRRGFTLIEVMIVVAMIAIIAAIAAPKILSARLQWPQQHLGEVVTTDQNSVFIGLVATTASEFVICQTDAKTAPVFIALVDPKVAERWSFAVAGAELQNVICSFTLSNDSPGPRPFGDGVTYDAVDFQLLSWQEKVYVPMVNSEAILQLRN